MATFFDNSAESVSISTVDGFMTYLRSKIVLEATQLWDVNTSSAAASADRRYAREFIFQCANGGFGWFARMNPASITNDEIRYGGMLGMKGPFAITAVSQTATNVTVTSAALAAVAVSGDLVCINGCADSNSNVSYNSFVTAEGTGFGVASSPSGNDVTFSLGSAGVSQTRSAGAGGYAWIPYNVIGGRAENGSGANQSPAIRITDGTAITVRGVADEDGVEMVVSQGSGRWLVKCGHYSRKHIPVWRNGRAALASDVTGDGSSEVIIPLDRTTNFEVSQSLLLVPFDDAYPNTGGKQYNTTQIQAVTVTAVDSATQIRAVLPAHTFKAGCMIGEDPVPFGIFGNGGSAISHLTSTNYFQPSFSAYGLGGVRTNRGTALIDSVHILVGTREGDTTQIPLGAPDARGYYHMYPLQHATNSPSQGKREWKNIVFVSRNSGLTVPASGDIARTSSDDYWTCTTQTLGSTSPNNRLATAVGPHTGSSYAIVGVFSYGRGADVGSGCVECNEIALTLEASVVSNDGGYVLSFERTGATEGQYRMYVVLDADGSYVRLLPDARGDGERVRVDSNGSFSILTPLLPVGGPYRIQGYSVTGDEVKLISNEFLTVVPAQVRSGVYSLRQLMPKNFFIGTRHPKRLRFPQS